MRKIFEEIKAAKDGKIVDQKRMAQLIVARHQSNHYLTSDEKKKELEELEVLLGKSYIYKAAKELQLPLPDIKNISEGDVAELLRWKESKLKEPYYDRYKIIEDVAQKYQEMQDRKDSTVSTQVDSLTSLSSQESQPSSSEEYIRLREQQEGQAPKKIVLEAAGRDESPKILRRTDSYNFGRKVDSLTSLSSQESQPSISEEYIKRLRGQREGQAPNPNPKKRALEAKADREEDPKMLRTDSYNFGRK